MNVSSIASATASAAMPPQQPAAHSAGAAADAAASESAKSAGPAANASAAASGSNVAPDARELQQALEDVQAVIRPIANDLTFSIDEDTGRTLIKIVDSQTDEVIRQIPSEELLRISKALDKLQGLLLKQEA